MINLTESIIKEQEYYKRRLEEAIDQGLSAQEFKKYSGGMGVYPQKKNGAFMVRPRTYSGIVSLKQLKLIGRLAKKYAKEPLHLTTRQSFQFHNVGLRDTWKIIEALLQVGIITVGAGGNSIRNISIPALAGVDPYEIFDVTPYAVAATNYILSLDGLNTLPRKYKIAFSGDNRDLAKAKLSDLGFIAVKQRGVDGFEVYGGGGVGSNPEIALLLASFIPSDQILYHIGAMKKLFEDHGDRTNRNKARIRYIVKRLGNEAFVKLYNQYLEEIIEAEALVPDLGNIEKVSVINEKQIENNDGPIRIRSNGISIIRQKNKKHYALYLHPVNGDMTHEDFDKLISLLEASSSVVSVRLASTQGLYIRNLTASEVKKASRLFSHLLPKSRFDRSVSCTGARQCLIGRQDSQALLEELKDAFSQLPIKDRKLLPELRISGCRNSCALHQSFQLGFEGSAIKTGNGTEAAYKVFIGGCNEGEEFVFGHTRAVIPVDDIGPFLERILAYIKDGEYKDFGDLYEKSPDSLWALLKDYEERK